MTASTVKRRRGRPAIEHDNRRVRLFLRAFDSNSDIRENLPTLDDVLTGIVRLQTEGQDSSRPLSRGTLLHVLQHCKTISTEAVQAAMGPTYSITQVKRYALAARVASKVIDHNLNMRPSWVTMAELQGLHCRLVQCIRNKAPLLIEPVGRPQDEPKHSLGQAETVESLPVYSLDVLSSRKDPQRGTGMSLRVLG
jgi:hypothetical protein